MTEAEWMACADPAAMVEFLGEDGTRSGCARVSERKLRLWVEACRLFVPLVRWPNKLETPAEVERATDFWCRGSSWVEECPLALRAALLRDLVGNPWRPVRLAKVKLACGRCGCETMYGDNPGPEEGEQSFYCKACYLKQRWNRAWGKCPWLTPTVLSLARAAYAERWQACRRCAGNPDRRWRDSETCLACHGTGRTGEGFLDPVRLAVLSDALEEADCEEAAILEHLRSPGPHVPGCWCVDTLLGLE